MVEKKSRDGYIYVVQRKKGVVSEFFDHMLAYGGFSIEDGVMTVWGDPSVFTPVRAMVHIQRTLRLARKDADDVFYWIGRLYGKNSTLILMKKFGFDKHKLPDFVNGATQDGFGYMEIKTFGYRDKELKIMMTGEKSPLAVEYKKRQGKQRIMLDSYMSGILAGGAEPLFDDQPIEVKERECMAQGRPKCVYDMKTVDAVPNLAFWKEMPFKESLVLDKTRKLALGRQLHFTLFARKRIEFGDGRFVLQGVQGFNMSAYEHIVLDKILRALLGDKKFAMLKDEVAEITVEDTFDKRLASPVLRPQTLQAVLGRLMMLGFGKLEVFRIGSKSVILRNSKNPYASDEKSIFGAIDDLPLDLMSRIIRQAFLRYFKKKVKVSVMKSTVLESYLKVDVAQ